MSSTRDRKKGYGATVGGNKAYAMMNCNILKKCSAKSIDGCHYYHNLTEVDFGRLRPMDCAIPLNFNADYVLCLKTNKKTLYIPCQFEDLFKICFNSRILHSVPTEIQDFVMIKHISENINLRFVLEANGVMFFQSNKSKGERNAVRIAFE